eukprot:2214776-Rhodomonas_salina.1
MRKQFFWGCRTDSTDCLTSVVVAMSCEMALPGVGIPTRGYPGTGYPGTGYTVIRHRSTWISWANLNSALSYPGTRCWSQS